MAKIWKAILIVTSDKLNFSVELQDEDYKEEPAIHGWIYRQGWVCNTIPKNMSIERLYGGYKAVQGFTTKLTKKEEQKLKQDMKKEIKNRLEIEKQVFLKEYNETLKTLKEVKE